MAVMLAQLVQNVRNSTHHKDSIVASYAIDFIQEVRSNFVRDDAVQILEHE
jgi:hypothetical protein